MSQPTANCPNCGAPLKFLWSSAVQTTCEYCKAILVRTDVDLKKVGEVADLPIDPSPIQIGTEGIWNNKPFVVVGRIIYEYDSGTWNEWHFITNDGASGWLSDAMLDYAVSFLASPKEPLPIQDAAFRGSKPVFDGVQYTVTSVTHAHYVGVQGELPFQYWDKSDLVFADLRTGDARFGTIDFSEQPPLLFLGQATTYADLKLKNVKEFEGWS
jgi:hypothetical protein